MANAAVKLADVIVPSRFTSYTQKMTEVKSRLISSGAVVRDAAMDAFLAGGGLTFSVPSWKDVPDDTDNVSTDDDGTSAETKKIGASQEIAVRLSRNQHWSDMDLVADLAGSDPMLAIGDRVAAYWTRRLQAAYVATMKGVFADNDAAAGAGEHVQYDLRVDNSNGGVYSAGVSDFSAEAFIDAQQTLGDSQEDLSLVFMHSIVYSRAKKNNLIDFIPDSTNPAAERVPMFLGHTVVVDDGMPLAAGVAETWLFGPGAMRLGVGTPSVPTEVSRLPLAGTGGGQSRLHSRVMWSLHPAGHKFAVASPASGGPSNAATAGNLAHVDSWMRVFAERKQIKIARLITTEY